MRWRVWRGGYTRSWYAGKVGCPALQIFDSWHEAFDYAHRMAVTS